MHRVGRKSPKIRSFIANTVIDCIAHPNSKVSSTAVTADNIERQSGSPNRFGLAKSASGVRDAG